MEFQEPQCAGRQDSGGFRLKKEATCGAAWKLNRCRSKGRWPPPNRCIEFRAVAEIARQRGPVREAPRPGSVRRLPRVLGPAEFPRRKGEDIARRGSWSVSGRGPLRDRLAATWVVINRSWSQASAPLAGRGDG